MSQYEKGETLYVVRSGMPDLINRQVLVVGDGALPGTLAVTCVGDWLFPHGASSGNVAESNLSRTRKKTS